jgi:nitroreductase
LRVETWDAIRARRNVRRYTDQPIERADLDRILEAGRRAPSGSNWQPWDFVVVTGRPRLTELAKVWRGAGHVAQSAATIAMVAPVQAEQQRREILRFDLGQATMSIMIAAADLGIGSGHASVGDQDLARQLLGFPEDRFLAFMIALGYPADRPLAPIARPDRRPFEEVVHFDHW